MPTKTTITYVDGHAVAVTSEQVPPSKITPLYIPEDERMRIIAEEQAAEDTRSEG